MGARDLKVRRSPQVRANRETPGVHRTFRQSRAQRAPREGALATCVAANAPDPEGTPVAAPIGVSRSSTSVSRTPGMGWQVSPPPVVFSPGSPLHYFTAHALG